MAAVLSGALELFCSISRSLSAHGRGASSLAIGAAHLSCPQAACRSRDTGNL